MSNASSFSLPIVDYQLATTNQAQLLAQFQKSSTTSADIAAYQSGVAKITTVDQFLSNYKVLNVALSAFGMQDAIGQKGLLKQLLIVLKTNRFSLWPAPTSLTSIHTMKPNAWIRWCLTGWRLLTPKA